MRKEPRYPIGQQSFSSLIQGGCLHVDKTKYIENIVNGSQYYFLGRPRRFGKSLFLSTLKCFFEGRRELFKGLYADTMDWNWEPYPVFHIALNMMNYNKSGRLVFNSRCTRETLAGIEPNSPNPLALLYQTGYLTIKSYNPRTKLYTLGLPNTEVKEGLINNLLPYYASMNAHEAEKVGCR